MLNYFQTIEELGAAAYLGQAPNIQNKDLLTAAVSIHNVEGQHAAVLSESRRQTAGAGFCASENDGTGACRGDALVKRHAGCDAANWAW